MGKTGLELRAAGGPGPVSGVTGPPAGSWGLQPPCSWMARCEESPGDSLGPGSPGGAAPACPAPGASWGHWRPSALSLGVGSSFSLSLSPAPGSGRSPREPPTPQPVLPEKARERQMPEKKSWGGGWKILKMKENLRGTPLWISESCQLAAVWRAEPIPEPRGLHPGQRGPPRGLLRGGQRSPQAAGVPEACQNQNTEQKWGGAFKPKETETPSLALGPSLLTQLLFIFDAGRH